MKDHWVYLKEEFSDAFLEQFRIRVHGGREDDPCSSKSALSNGVIKKKIRGDLPETFASKNEYNLLIRIFGAHFEGNILKTIHAGGLLHQQCPVRDLVHETLKCQGLKIFCHLTICSQTMA
jgi:hypothetical protein